MLLMKIVLIVGWLGFLVSVRYCVILLGKLEEERRLRYVCMVLYLFTSSSSFSLPPSVEVNNSEKSNV